MMMEINYEIVVDTDEDDRRLELLHTNVRKYGTISNTVAKAAEFRRHDQESGPSELHTAIRVQDTPQRRRMHMRVGINGMGRIGRLALRAPWAPPIAVTTTRAAATGSTSFMSTRSRAVPRPPRTFWNSTPCRAAGARTSRSRRRDAIADRRRRLGFSAHRRAAADIPWGDLGVDVVLECTGKFLNHATLDGHLKRGAKRVIVAAPVKEADVLNIVVGVNHHLYDPARHRSSPPPPAPPTASPRW